MAWIPLTAERFADKLSPTEKTALDGIKSRVGTTADELLARELVATSHKVLGYCPPKCPRGDVVVVDGVSLPTIPIELQDDALALVRQKYFTGLPGMGSLWTKERNDEYLQALATLKEWAKGLYNVAPPTTEASSDEQPTGGAAEFFQLDDTGFHFP